MVSVFFYLQRHVKPPVGTAVGTKLKYTFDKKHYKNIKNVKKYAKCKKRIFNNSCIKHKQMWHKKIMFNVGDAVGPNVGANVGASVGASLH